MPLVLPVIWILGIGVSGVAVKVAADSTKGLTDSATKLALVSVGVIGASIIVKKVIK